MPPKHKKTPRHHTRHSHTQLSPPNQVLDDVSVIKNKQKLVDETLYAIKKENEALWKEVASLRQKHHHQQQIVNKLIHFLVHLANPVYMANLKRAKPLMIDSQAASFVENILSRDG
jgi:heat shock transcription factor 1